MKKDLEKLIYVYFVFALILSFYDVDFKPWFNLFNLSFKSNL